VGETSVDDPARAGRSGAALEERARSAHLVGDYAATIGLYERAYQAYRREGELLCAARAARTVSWFRGWIYGEWAVANGWMARSRGLLDQAGDDTQERGWVLLAGVIENFGGTLHGAAENITADLLCATGVVAELT